MPPPRDVAAEGQDATRTVEEMRRPDESRLPTCRLVLWRKFYLSYAQGRAAHRNGRQMLSLYESALRKLPSVLPLAHSPPCEQFCTDHQEFICYASNPRPKERTSS